MKLPSFNYEKQKWGRGVRFLAGVDEVGRGAFAGPVVAAAVIFSTDINFTFNDVGLQKVRDSKTVPEKEREELSIKIKKHALSYSIAKINVSKIDKYGVGKCAQLAFAKAIKNLKIQPEHILIDAFYIKALDKSIQTPIIKGDTLSFSISAASIIAKVYRDNLMKKLAKKYPQYNLAKHKGYGTKEHRQLIKKHGLSQIHRKSFRFANSQF